MKKTILVVMITTLILLSILSGCSNKTQLSDEPCAAPVSVVIADGDNARDAVTREIRKAKSMTQDEHMGYSNYLSNNVSEIKEFYSLDNLKIDGYELQSVSIAASSICFNFASIEAKKDVSSNFIQIGVVRTDWEHKENFLKDGAAQAEEQGWGYLTADNMLYSEKHGLLEAELNDTFIMIQLPQGYSQHVIDGIIKERDRLAEDEFQSALDYAEEANRVSKELNNYEFLRELAFRVIKTAELINVE